MREDLLLIDGGPWIVDGCLCGIVQGGFLPAGSSFRLRASLRDISLAPYAVSFRQGRWLSISSQAGQSHTDKGSDFSRIDARFDIGVAMHDAYRQDKTRLPKRYARSRSSWDMVPTWRDVPTDFLPGARL